MFNFGLMPNADLFLEHKMVFLEEILPCAFVGGKSIAPGAQNGFYLDRGLKIMRDYKYKYI